MAKGIAKPEEIEYWNQWIELNEENRRKAKEANSALVGFEFKSPAFPDLERQWSKLRRHTTEREKPNIYSQREKRSAKENTLRWIFRVAALFLIATLAGLGGFYFPNSSERVTGLQEVIEEKTITTSEGEQKTLRFSNDSKVILNNNSSLTYRLHTQRDTTIHIRLVGEAWFEAQIGSQSGQPAFAVATPDGIIRDIGTKFLVTVQNGQSRVILQEGIVEVEPLEVNGAAIQDEEMKFRVQKGEMVAFNRSNVVTKQSVNTTFYTSWATGYMQLDQSGVKEFADYVEKRFRVKVEIRDSGLTDIRLNGTVYFRSLDELMRSVSEVIGIPVYRSSSRDTVYIGNLE